MPSQWCLVRIEYLVCFSMMGETLGQVHPTPDLSDLHLAETQLYWSMRTIFNIEIKNQITARYKGIQNQNS